MRSNSPPKNPYVTDGFDVLPTNARSRLRECERALPSHLAYWDKISQHEVRDRFLLSYTTSYLDVEASLWTPAEVFSFLADAIIPTESVRHITSALRPSPKITISPYK